MGGARRRNQAAAGRKTKSRAGPRGRVGSRKLPGRACARKPMSGKLSQQRWLSLLCPEVSYFPRCGIERPWLQPQTRFASVVRRC